MNKDNAFNDLMHFLSIEGITGQEKNIAHAVKQSLIEAKVPEEYIFFDKVNIFLKHFINTGFIFCPKIKFFTFYKGGSFKPFFQTIK